MFFKKILEKIIIYLKRFFQIKEKPNINTLRDISLLSGEAYKKSKNRVDCADISKLYKEIEFCADVMRFTCTPEIFISGYYSLSKAAENLRKQKCTDNALKEYNVLINKIICSIAASYISCKPDNRLLYSVTFRSKRKTYYYFAGDKEYKIGQYVIAPAGKYFEPAVVKIVGKHRFDDGKLPIPKSIIKTIVNSAI